LNGLLYYQTSIRPLTLTLQKLKLAVFWQIEMKRCEFFPLPSKFAQKSVLVNKTVQQTNR